MKLETSFGIEKLASNVNIQSIGISVIWNAKTAQSSKYIIYKQEDVNIVHPITLILMATIAVFALTTKSITKKLTHVSSVEMV